LLRTKPSHRVDEYKVTILLPAPVVLADGTYWVEIFNNAGAGDNWFWEFGNLDAVNGIFNYAFSFTTPGAVWEDGAPAGDLALEITDQRLPVELVHFSAIASDSHIQLEWATASELNNAGFEIEAGVDGRDFRRLGFVEGSGTTNEAKSYSYEFDALTPGLNYVRLRQVDFDGSFE
jgi:hypothetical protein